MKLSYTEVQTYRNATIWHVATRNGEFYHWKFKFGDHTQVGDAKSIRGAKMAITRNMRLMIL